MITKSLLDNQALKIKLDAYLAKFFEYKISSSREFGQPYQTLVLRMQNFTLRGGKRLRPYLCYLGFAVSGGLEGPPIEVLAAIELFHNSLLIHDDIMDRDLSRYGGPNIAGQYLTDFTSDAHHLATSAAILAGDLSMAFAQELILSSKLKAEDRYLVLSSLASQNQEVIAGQLLDTLPTPDDQTTAESVRQIQLHKTAAYTTIGPLLIGATMSPATQELRTQLVAYGENLGLLFQTTDDLLGMFGGEETTGKPNCTDLHENKPTALFLYAKELCKGTDLNTFLSLLGKPHHAEEDITEVRNILVRSGAKAETEKLALSYASRAVTAIAEVQGAPAEALRSMPDQLVRRTR